MPRGSTKRISKRLIDTLKPRAKPYEVRDGKLKGFLLRVQPTGRCTYYCEYDRGKRKKIGSSELLTPTEARDQALQILADHNPAKSPAPQTTPAPIAEPAPVPAPPASLTLEQFLNDEYQPWAEANLKWGAGTVNRVRVLFCPELGNKNLHELTPWLLEKWCISRKKRSKVSASTISRDLATLSSVLSKAVQWGLIEKNPVKGVKASKAKSQEKTRYLTKEEEGAMRAAMDSREQRIREKRVSGNAWRSERQKALYDDLTGKVFADHLKPMVLLTMNTGLRRNELFQLRWTDVYLDVQHPYLTVRWENSKNGRERAIQLNSEAVWVLREWKAQCQNAEDTDLVFIGKFGAPFTDVKKGWLPVLREAGIKDFRWHDLRHHFASRLVMAGVDLNTVRELLGHADLKMTLRYAHLAPEHKAAAVRKIEWAGSGGNVVSMAND